MVFRQQMLLGISTCFDYSIPFGAMCRLIADAGFRVITVGGNVAHSGYDRESKLKEAQDVVTKSGLTVDSVHVSCREELDLTDPDQVLPVEREPQPQELPAVPSPEPTLAQPRPILKPTAKRLESIKRAQDAINAAARVGAGIVILHPSPDSFPAQETRSRISAARDSLRELIPYAAERKVQLALENLSSALAMQVFEALCERFPELMVCYDSSHAQLSGDTFGVLRHLRNRVIALHISDNQGKADDHCLPFEGIIAWDEFAFYCRRLGQVRILMLEVEIRESAFKAPGEFLGQAARRGRQLIQLVSGRSTRRSG